MESLAELFAIPSFDQSVTIVIRLLAAALLGGLLGAERELIGKAAGLRTHMLVALAAALFAIVGTGRAEFGHVIQGVAVGIGFIGAGTILKQSDQDRVTGLTTAASVWLTAAIGVSAGVGTIWVSIAATLFAWIILNLLPHVEARIGDNPSKG